MISDKYSIAHRHALIVRAIGASMHEGEDISNLVNMALKSCLDQLIRYGCDLVESKTLLNDALDYQLTLVSMIPSSEMTRDTLKLGLARISEGNLL